MVTFRGSLVASPYVDYYKLNRINISQSVARKKAPIFEQTLKINKKPTSFVELEPTSDNDKYAVLKAEKIWGNRAEYSSFIASMFDYAGEQAANLKTRFFVLTGQLDDFDYLNPEDFLGMVQTTKLDDNSISIDALQVNPFYVWNNPYSRIKHVGNTLLQCLKNEFLKANFIAFSPLESVPFFELNGFVSKKTIANKKEICMFLQNNDKSGIEK